ncbi:MAG: hypothetical protein M1834_001718 [Cirrosporium novae-zelandiae]|nr:MAG: hypothetical protein M1834_001718 [Cirrosporium novae-zelandiae]
MPEKNSGVKSLLKIPYLIRSLSGSHPTTNPFHASSTKDPNHNNKSSSKKDTGSTSLPSSAPPAAATARAAGRTATAAKDSNKVHCSPSPRNMSPPRQQHPQQQRSTQLQDRPGPISRRDSRNLEEKSYLESPASTPQKQKILEHLGAVAANTATSNNNNGNNTATTTNENNNGITTAGPTNGLPLHHKPPLPPTSLPIPSSSLHLHPHQHPFRLSPTTPPLPPSEGPSVDHDHDHDNDASETSNYMPVNLLSPPSDSAWESHVKAVVAYSVRGRADGTEEPLNYEILWEDGRTYRVPWDWVSRGAPRKVADFCNRRLLGRFGTTGGSSGGGLG